MITFKHVTHTYQETSILEDVNLTLEKGRFYYVHGESGAGKSTFLRLLHKSTEGYAGTISLAGTSLQKIPDHQWRRKVSMVFQDYRLLPDKTIEENIMLAGAIIGQKPSVTKQKTAQLLEKMGLKGKESCFPSHLSGGEQQRAAIARALISEPIVLLADEPTGNLDWKNSCQVMDLLLDIQRERGMTVLMVTHSQPLMKTYPQVMLRIVDKKVTLHE